MVAQDERVGAAVIRVEVERHGIAAIGEDDERARYTVAERLHAAQPAGPVLADAQPVRVLVEVLRRLGGINPRALVGGQFAPTPGDQTVFEVCVGGTLDGPHECTCPAILWSRPFAVGLPPEFAGAVLEGITHNAGADLPPGVLTVDRAGFDEMESSAAVFRQAANLLRQAIAARLHHRDIETEVHTLLCTW